MIISSFSAFANSPTMPLIRRKRKLESFQSAETKEFGEKSVEFEKNKNGGNSNSAEGPSPKLQVLGLCGQIRPLQWSEAYSKKSLNIATKIGEGVYGEVFSLSQNGMATVIKVVPIEGIQKVNGEVQKSFSGILPEIRITQALSNLSHFFIQVHGIRLLRGFYPKALLKSWDDNSGPSQNDRPDMFKTDQLYVVFEFEHGGCPLERVTFKDPREALSVLSQLAQALALAEKTLEFEHRDLHVGNILLQKTRENFVVGPGDVRIPTFGNRVKIIDFTNSRIKQDGKILFTDLSLDEALFQGPMTEYQFDIYRIMRKLNRNNWSKFNAKSNVLWLHYICDKLIKTKAYGGRKLEGAYLRKFNELLGKICDFNSCNELVQTVQFF